MASAWMAIGAVLGFAGSVGLLFGADTMTLTLGGFGLVWLGILTGVIVGRCPSA